MHLEGQHFSILLGVPVLQRDDVPPYRLTWVLHREASSAIVAVLQRGQALADPRDSPSSARRSYHLIGSTDVLRLGELLQVIHRPVELVQIYSAIDPADLALVRLLPKHPPLPASRNNRSL